MFRRARCRCRLGDGSDVSGVACCGPSESRPRRARGVIAVAQRHPRARSDIHGRCTGRRNGRTLRAAYACTPRDAPVALVGWTSFGLNARASRRCRPLRRRQGTAARATAGSSPTGDECRASVAGRRRMPPRARVMGRSSHVCFGFATRLRTSAWTAIGSTPKCVPTSRKSPSVNKGSRSIGLNSKLGWINISPATGVPLNPKER